MKCAYTDVFVLVRGKCRKKNYFFSPPFIGANWFPPHSFVPTPVLPSFHDLTSAHKTCFAATSFPGSLSPLWGAGRERPWERGWFCRLSWKKFACCFLVQSRPNTIANQQRIVIWHYEGRWNATCHELSCLEAGHRPL